MKLILRSIALAMLALTVPSYSTSHVCSLPLAFEPNQGQTGPQCQYVARAPGLTVALGADRLWVLAAHKTQRHKPGQLSIADEAASRPVCFKLKNANADARGQAADLLPGKSNYFIGDINQWRHDIPNYASVRFSEVYPGVDLRYYGTGQQLEHDFIVSPSADPSRIRITVDADAALRLATDGALIVKQGKTEMRFLPPVAYQQHGDARDVIQCAYVLDSDREASFRLGAYDRASDLVIDPVLAYGTYIGGTGDDECYGLAVDGSGNMYLCGSTTGAFPVASGYDLTFGGGTDAYVMKINPNTTGTAGRVFATYLGGSNFDEANGIVLDAAGYIYICGDTLSANFPKTYQPVVGSALDAFVAQFNPNGNNLLYSVKLGGSGNDFGAAVAVDSIGRAYITGQTQSTNFPLSNAYKTTNAGAGDAYVTRINSSGTALGYSTFLGGTGTDQGIAIAADADGRAYVCGSTTSTNFPVISGSFQTKYGGGGADAFVVKFNTMGSDLIYSTYLGGGISSYTALDVATGIAFDTTGNAYVAGYTSSTNFPIRNAFQSTYAGGDSDAFVTKIRADGTDILYSTFFGGSSSDAAYGLAVDAQHTMCITGETTSTNLPLANALETELNGGIDAFAAKLSAGGTNLIFSTYLGGTGADVGYAIAIDPKRRVYVAGTSQGVGLPVSTTPFQSSLGGGRDAFALCLDPTVTTYNHDTFDTDAEAAAGSNTGWSRLGQGDPSLVHMDYDSTAGAYRTQVFPNATKYRTGGWMANRSEWLPYSSVGSDNYVRAKFYLYATGQAVPTQLNTIPTFRLRVCNRFAVSSYLDVWHHSNDDPTNQSVAQELRPSSDPSNPSLYRVDYDPIDVPFLATSTTNEGITRGYDAFSIDPQDNGYIGMTESSIGVYPASTLGNDVLPGKVYSPTGSTAGTLRILDSSTDIMKFTWLVSNTGEGTPAVSDAVTQPLPAYTEGNFGVRLNSDNCLSTGISVIRREFNPGTSQAQRVRVEEGKQYKIRFHVVSNRPTNQQGQLVLRSRSAKFAWVQRLEIGGAWCTGSYNNYMIAQQSLPGVGCANPDRDSSEKGGWYTLLAHSPLNIDLRPDATGTISSRMPNLSAQPGPGSSSASKRDLRVAADIYDTMSTGANKAQEASDFTIDRIEVRAYPLVDD